MCKEVYTFVIVAWLTRTFFLWSLQLLRQGLHNCHQQTMPKQVIRRDAISPCGDSIEGKLVTPVDELKEPDCGNASQTLLMNIVSTWTNWGCQRRNQGTFWTWWKLGNNHQGFKATWCRCYLSHSFLLIKQMGFSKSFKIISPSEVCAMYGGV